jgi:hypothetical protein
MKKKIPLIFISFCFILNTVDAQQLKSPDGNLTLNFSLQNNGVLHIAWHTKAKMLSSRANWVWN